MFICFHYLCGRFRAEKKGYDMHRLGKYRPTDSMARLIADNYRILLVMGRFGIGLGFGDRNIGEVCRDSGVDTPTFLAIANMLLDEDDARCDLTHVSVPSLLAYLHNSHSYFLGYRLPGIRRELVAVVGENNDLARAVIDYFDEYAEQVRQHMEYEEATVFPYVRALLEGQKSVDYNIDIFRRQHDQVEARLTEFKNILIKYYPSESSNEVNNVLFDIYNCENDLASHNAIEDKLFVPAIALLEENGRRV